MAKASIERRLAAILVADVVGYARLVEQDEAETLSALKALRREVIDPLLAEHHGRIVKLMGDGVLAEFGSVVDAVACAVAVQRAVTNGRTASLPSVTSSFASASTSVTWSSRAMTCSVTGSTSRRVWNRSATRAG
jgi:hypothetical protein